VRKAQGGAGPPFRNPPSSGTWGAPAAHPSGPGGDVGERREDGLNRSGEAHSYPRRLSSPGPRSKASGTRPIALLAALGAGTAALAAPPLAGRGAAAASWLVTLVVLTGLCLVAAERCARRLDALRLGVLVSLVALGCACRAFLAFGVGGFSPWLLPVMLAGYVFGVEVGFVAGVLTLLASSLLTGLVGPWVPYQMLGAGWIGVLAAAAGALAGRDAGRRGRLVLAAAGLLGGYAYGVLLNLTTWTTFYPAGGPAAFVRFYALSSFAWDSLRAVGDAALVLALGQPLILALDRLRARGTWEVVVQP
jgi:energy-coupling factor transport system substrate-specific component